MSNTDFKRFFCIYRQTRIWFLYVHAWWHRSQTWVKRHFRKTNDRGNSPKIKQVKKNYSPLLNVQHIQNKILHLKDWQSEVRRGQQVGRLEQMRKGAAGRSEFALGFPHRHLFPKGVSVYLWILRAPSRLGLWRRRRASARPPCAGNCPAPPLPGPPTNRSARLCDQTLFQKHLMLQN